MKDWKINSIITLEITDSEIKEFLYDYLSESEKNDFDKMESLLRKKQFLYSRVLLKYFGSKLLNVDPYTLIIDKEKNGKPYFIDYRDLHFSLSHSDKIIALVFSDELIGIDIEVKKKRKLSVAKKFFSKSEQNYIFQDESFANQRFLEIWTKKEAYIKYLGESIAYLNNFCVFDLKENLFFSEEADYILSIYTKKQKNDFGFYRLNEVEYVKKIKEKNKLD